MPNVEQKIYVLFYHDRTLISDYWKTIRKNMTLEKAKLFIKRRRRSCRYEIKDFGGRKEVTIYRYRIVFMVLFLWSGSLFAQNRLIVGMTALLSGAADGVSQALLFHYDQGWKPVHPKANDQFWDPDISWKNKYKDWDNGDKRARFPLSKTAFVSLTDGYHFTRMLNTKLLGASITYNFSSPRRDKWYWYAVETMVIFAIRAIGFHITYTFVYG